MSKASEEIFQQKTDFKEIILKVLKYKYYFIAITNTGINSCIPM